MGLVAIDKMGGTDPVLKVIPDLPTLTTDSSYAYFTFSSTAKNKKIVAAYVVYRISGTTPSTGAVWYDLSQNKWFFRQKEGEVTQCTYDSSTAKVKISSNNILTVYGGSITYEE